MTSRWAVTAICGECLQSDAGRAILSGAVGIASTRPDETLERCILCGFKLADAAELDAGNILSS